MSRLVKILILICVAVHAIATETTEESVNQAELYYKHSRDKDRSIRSLGYMLKNYFIALNESSERTEKESERIVNYIKSEKIDQIQDKNLRNEILNGMFYLMARQVSFYKLGDNTDNTNKTLTTSEKFDSLANKFKEYKIPLPNQYDSAKTLSNLIESPDITEEEFIKQIEMNIPAAKLHLALSHGRTRFGNTKSYMIHSLNFLEKNNQLDKEYLYELLRQQFLLGRPGVATDPIDGLTEILQKYIDIDDPPYNQESVLCGLTDRFNSTLRFLYKKPQYKNSHGSLVTNKDAVSYIDKTLSLGANIHQTCKGGFTPAKVIKEMIEDGIINIKGSYLEHLLNENKKVDDCLKLKGNIYLAELCLSVDVLNHYERDSNDFSKSIGKSPLGKVAILESVQGKNECTISFFDKMMSHAGKGVTKEVELRVSHSKYKYDFTLSSSDKENFLREIKKLMKD